MNNRIIITYGENLREMTREILKKSELEKRIPKGSYIGIKPNLVLAAVIFRSNDISGYCLSADRASPGRGAR